MAEPSQKSPEMERYLEEISGFDRREFIRRDVCVPAPVGCGGPATEFRDEQSRREYSISGMCQFCQDKVWGEA